MKRFKSPSAWRLVDFDRTLFDTSVFVEWLWQTLENLYGVDAEAERMRAKEFYVYHGSDWYDYRFFDHIAAISQTFNVNQDALVESVLSIKERPDFMFPDAKGILGYCDEIVTFGNEPYQKFKLSFCPDISHIPRKIIQEPKADYVVRSYKDRKSVILIDDKHLEDELPEWVSFVLIDRQQAEPIIHHTDVYVSINSLDELIRL